MLPVAPLNGNVVYGSDVTIAKYTCNTGYTLQGYTEGFCQDDGTGWNTSVPDCGKITCILFLFCQSRKHYTKLVWIVMPTL